MTRRTPRGTTYIPEEVTRAIRNHLTNNANKTAFNAARGVFSANTSVRTKERLTARAMVRPHSTISRALKAARALKKRRDITYRAIQRRLTANANSSIITKNTRRQDVYRNIRLYPDGRMVDVYVTSEGRAVYIRVYPAGSPIYIMHVTVILPSYIDIYKTRFGLRAVEPELFASAINVEPHIQIPRPILKEYVYALLRIAFDIIPRSDRVYVSGPGYLPGHNKNFETFIKNRVTAHQEYGAGRRRMARRSSK